ncbi:hypothetical protein CKO50_12085 [Pseudoalteromonas sp. HM-SA03]|uniref:hypothetical protein n=1 Tax=Pseudoalteromonas sp. HM-SA03 TaxID=2029678 RepID=UPI000BAE22DF|nr:hypothetical protein [Pseudoalteromonas sp. HM-SA03]PAY01076.1 hypothetical protein CKO50_12085 [Pseudoalteromonas sp. HM-SA03]
MKRFSSIALVIVVLLVILNMTNLPWELRFSAPQHNYLFVMILATALPASVLLWSLCRRTKLLKMSGLLVALAAAVPSFIVFIFAAGDYSEIKQSGVDNSFAELNRLNVNNDNYVLYRTDRGATTSYGLVLRLEREIGFGIHAVKVVHSKYKAAEGQLELLTESQIKMQIQPYDTQDQTEVVVLDI